MPRMNLWSGTDSILEVALGYYLVALGYYLVAVVNYGEGGCECSKSNLAHTSSMSFSVQHAYSAA